MAKCATCGADWSSGQTTHSCMECGGNGAMEIPCMKCKGECGRIWKRVVMDSNDLGLAVFSGHCGIETARQLKEEFG